MIIPDVVRQHADDAASLRARRRGLLAAPNAKLTDLHRHDHRLEAHLDGLSVAGERAWPMCEAALAAAGAGQVFTATVRAIEDRRLDRLTRLLAIAESSDAAHVGLTSAFGWIASYHLKGLVKALLIADAPFSRTVGMTSCGMHRVDPGIVAGRWLQDADSRVRGSTFRVVGEVGCHQLVGLLGSSGDDDPDCRFWAMWSAVLLGDRNRGLRSLLDVEGFPPNRRMRARCLALQALDVSSGHGVLQGLAEDPALRRSLIRGSGIVGDPAYIPWLIKQMEDPALSRIAGEMFTLITGVDLWNAGLAKATPVALEMGPTADPADSNVDVDPDGGLTWPDEVKCSVWWKTNSANFENGIRYFMGQPVNHENCLKVLKGGFQRQRVLAAHYLCLLEPGTPLFNTSAPAWRQQRWLAKM
jgi:uncharacterized protein (TIGR02270 family)